MEAGGGSSCMSSMLVFMLILLRMSVLVHAVDVVDEVDVIVSTPYQLRVAMEDPGIHVISVNRSIALRAHNGWLEPVNLITSKVIEVKKEWYGQVEIDVDGLMMMDWSNKSESMLPVSVGFAATHPAGNKAGVTLTFMRVVLLGVRNTRMTMENDRQLSGLSLSLMNCAVSISCSDFYVTTNSCSSMPINTHEFVNITSILKEVTKPTKKTHKSSIDKQQSQKCSNFSPLVAKVCAATNPVHVDHPLPTASALTGMVGQIKDVLFLSHAMREVDVDDADSLHKELLSDPRRTWPGASIIKVNTSIDVNRSICPITLTHDTIIQGKRPRIRPTIALRFSEIPDCIVIPTNVTLTFKDIVLDSSLLDGLNHVHFQQLLPFVDVQAGGSIVLRHVMYKNSIQLTSFSLMTSIMGTPRMEKSGRPGDACQEALDKDQEWCMHLAEENCGGIRLCEEAYACPNRTTIVVDAAFQVPLAGGNASYYIKDTIIPSAQAVTMPVSSSKAVSKLMMIVFVVAISSIISLCIFTLLKLSHRIIARRRMTEAHGEA